ncbi:MAG: N-formylglutamate deformylase [Aliishimia sp.]
MQSVVEVWQGDSPIVLSLPHTGTHVPEEMFERLNARGQALSDTDWHVDQLYDGVLPGATTVRAKFHRYVIDPNRDPAGESLYPGQATTDLVPLTDFEGEDIWAEPPNTKDVQDRLAGYHAPYHAALRAELKRVHALYGVVVLFDCHSIRSQLPYLFEGVLPDFSVGTNGGATCAAEIESSVINIASGALGYRAVLNGRFKGGWTTRHYGRPEDGLHAIQLELSQAAYLETEAPPWTFSDVKSGELRLVLAKMLNELQALAPSLVS